MAASYAIADMTAAYAPMANFNEKGYVLLFDSQKMAEDGIRGIDINETFVVRGGNPQDKFEVKIPVNIEPKYIVGAYEITSGDLKYHANPNYTGKLKNDEQSIKDTRAKPNTKEEEIFTPGEAAANNERLQEIKNLIEKKTRNGEWVFGRGGSNSEIIIDGKKHKVPTGIKAIYAIINGVQLDASDKLHKIYEIANKRKNQHISFFGFGERQPLTRYVYDKIADIAKSQQIPTHAKPSNLFFSPCALHA